MDHLGKIEECPILSCQIGSNMHGKAYDYFSFFIFLAASVSGPRNYLEMNISITYSKFQEWIHLILGGKGQIELWGECVMLIDLGGL